MDIVDVAVDGLTLPMIVTSRSAISLAVTDTQSFGDDQTRHLFSPPDISRLHRGLLLLPPSGVRDKVQGHWRILLRRTVYTRCVRGTYEDVCEDAL